MKNSENLENLEQALIELRVISHSWSDAGKVYDTLIKVRNYLRYETVMTKELFDLYDDIVISLSELDSYPNETTFDGRTFTSVLTRFGFADFTRDDYSALMECR